MNAPLTPFPAARIETAGVAAEARPDAIVLLDEQGNEVASYSARAGLRIVAHAGDITLAAPAGRVVIEAREIVQRTGRWELSAARLFERVTDAYREAGGLTETRTGRLRCLVSGALQMLAGRTTIASDEDTSIDGKRVLLG